MTLPVGVVSSIASKLIKTVKQSFFEGIKKLKVDDERERFLSLEEIQVLMKSVNKYPERYSYGKQKT